MNKSTQCPDCQSTNIKYFDARKSYTCMDCGFSFSEQETKKLRIFLSYGHDHNEELVRLIKTDLEKRGHDVWFDKNEIKFGDEWRRSITDGILGSNRVLSFLSKHSTRDPGVCRDEIAIAIGVKGGNIQTILVESEKEVQPPVNIGHIQWLDMHDWQEKKAANEAEWKQWYQAKLAEIVRVVESEEIRRFAGEIEKLNEYLKPIKSDARISGLLNKGFYGREWLFEAVGNWRSETPSPLTGESRVEGSSRLFWIMGDPGVGKSAFAAQLTHAHGDKVIAAQFVEWDKPDHRDARRVVCSIAFQMATRMPDYRKLLLTLPEIKELDRKEASELFDYLLANPLKSVINGGREKLLIVIDALDEAGESGRNPLVEMLARNAHHLPEWLGIIVTSRPEFDVKTPFQALNPLPLDTKSESNKADIRDYLNNKLETQLQKQPNAEALVNQILEKSEGVFLYAERFCDDVHQGHISLDYPVQFPQGLGGIFAQYFQRQFPNLEKFRKEIRPALRAILAAREPLPLEILQKLFNWQDEELRDFTHALGSLFPITKTTDSETIKPYHKSLADWLGDETKAGVYFVSVIEGHRLLADYCLTNWKTTLEFPLSEAVFHMVGCSRQHDCFTILIDPLFQLLLCNHLGMSSLIRDFQLAELNANGMFGIVGAACQCIEILEETRGGRVFGTGTFDWNPNANPSQSVDRKCLDSATNRKLLHDTSNVAREWFSLGLSAQRCASFSCAALKAFPVLNSECQEMAILALERFSSQRDSLQELGNNIALIKEALINSQENLYSLATGQIFHSDEMRWKQRLLEGRVRVIVAALSLQPSTLLQALCESWRYYSVLIEPGRGVSAIESALWDVNHAFKTRLPLLFHDFVTKPTL